MHHDHEHRSTTDDAVKSPVPSNQAERRRLLLKGLGKGGTALAVLAPIKTLAVPTIAGGTKLCTVSGVQSTVGSQNTGTTTATCLGYSPTHYQTLANWPGYNAGPPAVATNTVDTITFTDASAFSVPFVGSGVTDTLMSILTTAPTSDNAVWVVALLNAIKNPIGFNYPYTPTQVLAFYAEPDPIKKANALAFFKGYMQTVG